ncbi:tetratricopeptide repeat protein [Taibaiella lutea]|uniref:Tetratricopeptide repeat protein n=1 Tax=Taibaiella lutea TaxID=2608001 RepID=A0A5M6CSG9_9BACT|nr:tetratricopeptide repeat protein [Taibaiella lutea]KAA5537330.1 tetratricopeptide repeat protein [Taibaiella lutea]
MGHSLKRFFIYSGVFSAFYLSSFSPEACGQIPVSNSKEYNLLKHGIEQFQQSHYILACKTIQEFLSQHIQPTETLNDKTLSLAIQQAKYILSLSNLKANNKNAVPEITLYIDETVNPVYKQRAAFALAQYYFQQNNLENAITYYEIAGIDNLSNNEIADAKFELAYSYFNEKKFDRAKPLFGTIKELPENKYYLAGNYYYGLLAYNDKDYELALKSFERIHNQEEYKDIIPYYEAEINYFKGNYDQVLTLSNRYLRKSDKLFYDKEMHLLTGQTYFEQKKFKEALPFFEHYYDNSEKIRKEELYELAYTYYRLEKWQKAIERFQPLSNAQDSLGQTSMYLLGDCYLKIGDKKGARNAFETCANMDYNPSQQEAASFLYAKLSYELGIEGLATRKLYDFIKVYPNSKFTPEAQKLLTGLLTKSSNYSEAFAIMSDMAVKDDAMWALYQQVGLGRAIQLMQSNQNAAADSVLNLSLQQPINNTYEAIAYFWKGDIAYKEKRYPQAIQFTQTFLDRVKGQEDAARRISPQATVQNANFNIGYAQLELGQYNDAATAFASVQNTTSNSGYNDLVASDAIVRQADAAFMQKDFDKAIQLYDKFINANVGNTDYAKYQKSLILGLQGNNDAKIQILNNLVSKYPVSEYKDEAQYELAVSYLESGRNSEAIDLLKSLSENTSIQDNLRAKALSKLAYSYQVADRDKEAITTYKKYIAAYPSAPDRAAATDALRNLYISTSQPEAYAQFLKENNMPEEGDAGIEQTYYAAAESDFGNNNWTKAVDGFTKYLNQFPNGNNANKAHYYRAESYYQLKDKTKALPDYDAVVNAGWSDFSDDAAARAAEIAYQNKDYVAAQKYYKALRSAALDNNNLQKAYTGLLITSYENKDFAASNAYADTLLSLPEINVNAQNEARLYKAKSLQNNSQFDEAMSLYQAIDKMNLGVASGEARYRMAEILFSQHKLKEAEEQASYAAQASGGSDYWTVKDYILIADILTEQKDYFNAKATLQSIVKNTSYADVKDEATKKLANVKQLEKSTSKLSEE